MVQHDIDPGRNRGEHWSLQLRHQTIGIVPFWHWALVSQLPCLASGSICFWSYIPAIVSIGCSMLINLSKALCSRLADRVTQQYQRTIHWNIQCQLHLDTDCSLPASLDGTTQSPKPTLVTGVGLHRSLGFLHVMGQTISSGLDGTDTPLRPILTTISGFRYSSEHFTVQSTDGAHTPLNPAPT